MHGCTHLGRGESDGAGLEHVQALHARLHDLNQLLLGVRLKHDAATAKPTAAHANVCHGMPDVPAVEVFAPHWEQGAGLCRASLPSDIHTVRWAACSSTHLAMRGRKRSGRSMVLAMPMTASREPCRVGHSMRLYNTCTEEHQYSASW